MPSNIKSSQSNYFNQTNKIIKFSNKIVRKLITITIYVFILILLLNEQVKFISRQTQNSN